MFEGVFATHTSKKLKPSHQERHCFEGLKVVQILVIKESQMIQKFIRIFEGSIEVG